MSRSPARAAIGRIDARGRWTRSVVVERQATRGSAADRKVILLRLLACAEAERLGWAPTVGGHRCRHALVVRDVRADRHESVRALAGDLRARLGGISRADAPIRRGHACPRTVRARHRRPGRCAPGDSYRASLRGGEPTVSDDFVVAPAAVVRVPAIELARFEQLRDPALTDAAAAVADHDRAPTRRLCARTTKRSSASAPRCGRPRHATHTFDVRSRWRARVCTSASATVRCRRAGPNGCAISRPLCCAICRVRCRDWSQSACGPA